MKGRGGGVRVSGGRLRVDSARAVDKLRSYQLADPLAWVLEIVRAGVLRGAEAIGVEGAGSDVFVAIACEPFEGKELTRLFEELVDPSPEPRARPLRLLAMGVNAALGRRGEGGATRFVDVYAVSESGSERVRFTPQVFEKEAETGVAKGLRALSAEKASPPTDAPRPRRGLLVHARAAIAIAALARWAMGEEPRELMLVREASRGVRVPLTVNGVPVPSDPSMVIVEPLPGGGHVALVTPRAGQGFAVLEAAELGVVLSRAPWSCGIGTNGAKVPLVLRVDRERLPTNAARSAVRWDEPLAAAALEEGREALARVIGKLVAELGGTTDPARRSWLRLVAIALLAAEVGGPAFRTRLGRGDVPELVRPLVDVPILYDAIGRARTPRELCSAPGSVEITEAFCASSLARWVGDVIAAPPGDPTWMLFGDLPPNSAAERIARAERALAYEARWLERPVLPPVVQGREGGLVRVGLPSETAGEVVLGVGKELVIALRSGGRALEERRVASPVGIAAVVDARAFTPTMTFDGVMDDAPSRAVLRAVDEAIVLGCEHIAAVLVGEASADDATTDASRVEWLATDDALATPRGHALVRYGIGALLALEDPDDARKRVMRGPLSAAAAWPTADGGAVSLRAIAEADAIGLVDRAAARPPALPRERIVLAVDDTERVTLKLLVPRARFVDYSRATTRRRDPRTLARETVRARAIAGLTFEAPLWSGFVGWLDESEARGKGSRDAIEAWHVGTRLGLHPSTGAGVPTIVIVDDDRIVPDERWAGGVDWLMLEKDHGAKVRSRELARALIDAWLGAPSPNLVARGPLTAPELVRAVLSEGAALELPDDVRAAFANLAILPRVGHDACVSAAEVAARGLGVPYAVLPKEVPGKDVRGIETWALALERDQAQGLARLLGTPRAVVDVTGKVVEESQRRRRANRITELLARPALPIEVRGATTTARIAGDEIRDGVAGVVPHARAGQIRVLVEGRPFANIEADQGVPPHVEAVVSIEASLVDEDGEALAARALPRLRGAVLAAARAMLVELATAKPAALWGDPVLTTLLEHLSRGRRKGETRVLAERLGALPSLPALDGSLHSVESFVVDDSVRFVREPLEWLGPLESETPHDLDRPIALVQFADDDPRRQMLVFLSDAGLVDVTARARQLLLERRTARGLVPRPTLSTEHVPALARTIEKLVEGTSHENKVRGALGLGAIALKPAAPSIVRFFEGGVPLGMSTIELVPPFEAALESPHVARGDSTVTACERDDVRSALRTALSLLLRALADDEAFDAAPAWALDAQRDAALLGGEEHLRQLGSVALFATTAGTRTSYDALVAQRALFGDVWWTEEKVDLVPLDPARIALALSKRQASLLGRVLRLTEATSELELDQQARQNMARPNVGSLLPSAKTRALGLDVAQTEEDGRELVVMPLLPRHESHATMELFFARKPLGPSPYEGEIPAMVWASARDFTPTRTWDGAKRDEVRLAVERTAAELAETTALAALPAPEGPHPVLTVDRAFMIEVPHAKQRVVRGKLTLGALFAEDDDDDGVRVLGRGSSSLERVTPERLLATAPKREPAPVPLAGTLALWGESRDTAAGTLDAVARHAYLRLLSWIGGRLEAGKSPDADLDRAHLVRGAALGFVNKGTAAAVLDLAMPFGLDTLVALRGIVELFAQQDARGEVVRLSPDERERAHGERATIARPMFVDDGSLAAQTLALALGDRVITLAEARARALGMRQAEQVKAETAKAKATTAKAEAEAEAEPTLIEVEDEASAPEPTPAKRPSVPPRAVQRAAPGPVEPLVASVISRLRALGRGRTVELRASRQDPSVTLEAERLGMAGGSDFLRAVSGRHASRERAAAVIAAHEVSLEPDTRRALDTLAALLR